MRRAVWVLSVFVLFGCGSEEQPEADSGAETTESSTAENSAETSRTAKEPTTADVLMQKARVHMSRGQAASAIESLSQAIGVNPDNALAYVMRAEVYVSLREDASALADYSTAIRLDPQNAKMRNTRGFFYMTRNQLDRALADFDAAIAADDQLAQAFNNRGLVRIARGDFKEGVSDFDAAITISDSYIDALNNRGYAQSELGNFDQAVTDFNAALNHDPKYHNALNNRGLVHFKQEHYDEAIVDFTKAIELQPYEAKYYQHRREAFLRLEKIKDAEKDADRIAWLSGLRTLSNRIARAPGDPDNYADRGQYLAESGENDRAIQDFNQAVQLGSEDMKYLTIRAAQWMRMELYRNAINDCTHVIKSAPSQAAYSIRGDSHFKLGDTARAIEDYESAKRIDATVAEAYLEHSKKVQADGDAEKAAELLQQAIRLNPRLETSRQ